MEQYLIKRLLLSIISIALVIVATFGMLRMIPGDALTAQIVSTGGVNVPPEQIAKMRESLGLNGSIPHQFATYTSHLIHWDWGRSFVSNQDSLSEFGDRLPITVELGLFAMILALAFGIPIGVLSALYQDSVVDYIGRTVAVLGLAIPNFWLGIVIIVFASREFHYSFPKATDSLFTNPIRNLEEFIIPSLVLSFAISATIMRLMRTAMLEVWRQEYIRTAHAKGMRLRTVVSRHALRNALLPVVTIVGAQLAFLVGGAVIVESLFNLRGVGLLVLQSVFSRDYPIVQTSVIVLAIALIIGNFATDMVYSWLDPRVHYS
jgi:peptide/nickel transport system permease protein